MTKSIEGLAEGLSTRLGELLRLFLKLGFLAFGGPAAHIAMLEEEAVEKRKWLSRQHFLDLVGATNLIPGPNSTEMVLHVGYERAGWAGLLVAGGAFIGPAVLITGVFAWVYVSYGTLPAVEPFLAGIQPAVLAVILGALWRLGGKAIQGWRLGLLAAIAAGAILAGAGEILVLAAGGLLGMIWLRLAPAKDPGPRPPQASAGSFGSILAAMQSSGASSAGGAAAGAASVAVAAVPAWKLGLFFLKVGAVLYGSGYVLVAFLQGGLVEDYGWLTQAQLLDAIAVGQLTPGPVLSTATFIGYIILGVPGALAATAGIFLPSFVFVAILNPIVPRLRDSAWVAAFLDAVNAAAVALMAAVTLRLGLAALTTWQAWVLALLSAVAVFRFRLNTAYLVLGAALAGYLLQQLQS